MLHPAQTVTFPLTLAVDASTGSGDLEAELRYDPADPFAVSLAIGIECSDPVVWTFGRDLIAEGLCDPVGIGDIRFEPVTGIDGHEIRITLMTDLLATLSAPRDTVVAFLVESFVAVPSGQEMDLIDVDAELNALLA